MSIEMSRREFIIGTGVAAAGLLLPESEGLDRGANSSDIRELRKFLRQSIENPGAILRPSTANLLQLVGREKPSEIGFAHNANSLDKIEAFVLDEDRDIAEVDCRIDDEGLYVSHSRGRKTDIDPVTVYDRVVASALPKAIKYDIKEPEAVRGIINSIEDRDRPCILNADLFQNSSFGLTPEQFVELSKGLNNAILSIGRKGDFGTIKDFVWDFIKLATKYPGTDFILPAHLVDFLSSIDHLEEALVAPNIFLMVYRTRNFALTKRHIRWIEDKFDPVKHPGRLFDTYFDL